MTMRRRLELALGFALIQAVIAAAVCRLPIAYGTVGAERMFDDVHLYYEYGSRTLHGEVPYRDFPLEYPAFAVPFFVLPRLFVSNFAAYRIAFAAEMFVAHALTLTLIAGWLARGGDERRCLARLTWVTLAVSTLCPLAVCRFDLLVACWAFATVVAWSSGRPGWAGALAGSGAMLKLVPGVVAVPCWASGRPGDPTARRRLSLGVFVTVVAAAALWAGLGGARVGRSFAYHWERGVEVGSVYAGGLMAAARWLDRPLAWVYRHKSVEVLTPWSDAAGSAGLPVQALALLAVAWRARRSGGREPVRYAGAAVLAFAAFGKVLSPQYLLWIVPFAACVPGRCGTWVRWLFLLACLTTTMIYPGAFHWLLDFRGWAIDLLNYRNAVLVGLWVVWTFAPTGPAPGSTFVPKRRRVRTGSRRTAVASVS